MEKNHKHEIGVEIAHHKETQRLLQKMTEDYRESKVKLEEKERALEIANIYSRQTRDTGGANTPAWKASTQSLNNVPESPHEKRKEYEKNRKTKEILKQKPPIKENESAVQSHRSSNPSEVDSVLEKQREDAQRRKQEMEIEMQRRREQEKEEAERKRKEAAEKERKLKEERELKEKKRNEEEEEKRKREKELLEEEDRKKRWISNNTVNNLNEKEKEKNSLEKNKKDELLAKLSLMDKPKEEESFKVLPNKSTAAFGNANKPGNSDTFNFDLFSSSTAKKEPVKPVNGQKDFKFSVEAVDNLHEGRASNSGREANKNDLLSKLFGNGSSSNLNGTTSNKNDDLFAFKTISTNSPKNSSSNITTTANKPKSPNFNLFGNANNSNNNNKNDHLDFFQS